MCHKRQPLFYSAPLRGGMVRPPTLLECIMQARMKKTAVAVAAAWAALAMGSAMLLAGCGGGETVATAAQAQKSDGDSDGLLKVVRMCDLSGCYIAWRVVDSDGDGVSDADELVAGSNPHDAASVPSLKLVATLAGKSTLPSFEAGRGAFAVYPEALQAQLVKMYPEYAAQGAVAQAMAFPLNPGRGDALSRVGISADLLKKHGIDSERDGFTVGLDLGQKTESGVPGRMVGGVDVRLISAEDDPVPLGSGHGAVVKIEFAGGIEKKTYEDGFSRTKSPDGTIVWRNEENKVTKVYPGQSGSNTYVNPDADGGASSVLPVPPEKSDQVIRLRGAAQRTIDGWELPDLTNVEVQDRKPLVMLVDDQYPLLSATLVDIPHITQAQPEVRPDLPHPEVPAGASPTGSGGQSGGGGSGTTGGTGGCVATSGYCTN
jgi:hypothetical protein